MIWGGAALFILARGWEWGAHWGVGGCEIWRLCTYVQCSDFLIVVDSWGLLWDRCHLLLSQGPWDIRGAQ